MSNPIVSVFFGAKSSGKTSLIQRLVEKTFSEKGPPALTQPNYKIVKHNDVRIFFWDYPSDRTDFEDHFQERLERCNHLIYCVDLSTSPDKETIKKQIEELKSIRYLHNLLIVGTKHDKANSINSGIVENIAIEKGCAYINFSAKVDSYTNDLLDAVLAFDPSSSYKRDNSGITDIKPSVASVQSDENPISLAINSCEQASLLRESLEKLKNQMTSLSHEKQEILGKEALKLVSGIKIRTHDDRLFLIDKFENQCQKELAGNHPLLKGAAKAVTAVAIAAVITIITAMIGFGVGFAVGAWTVPGAFISGILAGAAAATSVACVSGFTGSAAGALSIYGLYKSSPVERALEDVAQTARNDVHNKQSDIY
jgi:hypothetical protein